MSPGSHQCPAARQTDKGALMHVQRGRNVIIRNWKTYFIGMPKPHQSNRICGTKWRRGIIASRQSQKMVQLNWLNPFDWRVIPQST